MRDHNAKQNITIRLDRGILHKAKEMAARRNTSVSGFLTQQIEDLVVREEAYERARCEAMKLLEKGFRLRGTGMVNREELHQR